MGREMFVDVVGISVSLGNGRWHDHPRVVIAVVARRVIGRR
jgi:hypothetical protein